MLVALTRAVSPTLGDCELTHLARQPIDLDRAAAQHAEYERLLTSLGVMVVRVPPAPELPDAVFIEDTAVVLDEGAVLTRPGAASRRAELPPVATALAAYRVVHALRQPATLDGGDVLCLGRTLFVGRSERTNVEGIAQLSALASRWDYEVRAVEFRGCLHLKSAVTAIGDDVVLFNPAWVAAEAFAPGDALAIDPAEPYAANALRVGPAIVYAEQYPRTATLLLRAGLTLATVDSSELAKAEGALTCCSLLLEAI